MFRKKGLSAILAAALLTAVVAAVASCSDNTVDIHRPTEDTEWNSSSVDEKHPSDTDGNNSENKTDGENKIPSPGPSIPGEDVEKKYTVTYDLNGGKNSNKNPVEFTSKTENFTLEAPTKFGYQFIGWTYGGQDVPQLELTVDTSAGGDRAYVANWEGNKHVITLNAYGGTLLSDTVTVTYGEHYELPIPEKDGHLFLGWYIGNAKVQNGIWRLDDDASYVAKWMATVVYTGVELEIYASMDADSEPVKTVPFGTRLDRVKTDGTWDTVKLYGDDTEYYVLAKWISDNNSDFEFKQSDDVCVVVHKDKTFVMYYTPFICCDGESCLENAVGKTEITIDNLNKQYDITKVAEGDTWIKVEFYGTVKTDDFSVTYYKAAPATFYIQKKYFTNGSLDDVTYDNGSWTPIV